MSWLSSGQKHSLGAVSGRDAAENAKHSLGDVSGRDAAGEDDFECPECWKHWDREQSTFCKFATFARHVIDAILDIFSEHISTPRLEVHSNMFDTNTESCPHISLDVHSTHLFDRSRTLQNSEEKHKSSEESWEQVAVPPEEAKLAETPGGDSDIVSDNETGSSRELSFLVKCHKIK